ncbi:MAG TPA: hypothetical protein VG204_11755 [Terriglobia bacterium]|nr:hypothetical protein [Terriglobia bacterium]
MKNDRHAVDDRFLDKLLDATLERAGDVEPRPGLEGRVMTRIRAERITRPQFAWKWQLVAGLAALVLLVLTARFMLRSGSTAHPQRGPSVIASPSPAIASQSPLPQVASWPAGSKPAANSQPAGRAHGRFAPRDERRVRREPESVRVASYQPKQFPSPSPLSEEEKLLLHAKDAPPSVLVACSGNDAAGDLRIKDLDISPLENWPPDSDSEQK